ncbi:Atu4866 domain-containing protein [Streptomyces sp. NPDC001642]|uniref:Atu4866 domain-containing protein n=1 Tax=Streptomyces sp. NPDC001642 TaxID=3154392 RepID=UPI00331D58B8
MWVTADGHIQQELLPNGRYDEARGNRRSAYTGSCTVNGDHIDYVDDLGGCVMAAWMLDGNLPEPRAEVGASRDHVLNSPSK